MKAKVKKKTTKVQAPATTRCSGYMTDHPLYAKWNSIHSFCYTESNTSYRTIGAHGIRVCARWFDFWNFVEDVGMPEEEGMVLSRLDKTKNYMPGNVVWERRRKSIRRSKKVTKSTGKQVLQTIHLWYTKQLTQEEIAKRLGLPLTTIQSILRRKDHTPYDDLLLDENAEDNATKDC